MSSFVIDTSSVQIGQVIRTNITDQGIFRVFYNDIRGNMYCALNRESNYKQVIYNSAENRTEWGDDVSMNSPLYGGIYNLNELSKPSQDGRYYVFKYPTITSATNVGACDRGPISYFTEVQLQQYIKQGSSSGATYDTAGNGFGSTYPETVKISHTGGNIGGGDAYSTPWQDGVGFGYCTSERGGYALDVSMAAIIATANGLSLGGNGQPFVKSSGVVGLYAYNGGASNGMAFYGNHGNASGTNNKGLVSAGDNEYRPGISASTTFAMFCPDLINTTDYGNVRGVTNKLLNSTNSMNNLSNNVVSRFITEPWQTDISSNILSSGPSTFNAKYYMSSRRPKYVWLDTNSDPVNPLSDVVARSATDSYYKGRWTIFVDVANKVRDRTPPYNFITNDTSGNIYLSRSNRAEKPECIHLLFPHFKNNQINSGTDEEIKNVYVDLDLDISRNAINSNFDNIYARPYFIVCSDSSENVIIGRAAFDLASNGTTTQDTITVQKIFNPLTSGHHAKYCKIKVNHRGGATWDSTPLVRYHAVYHDDGAGGPDESHLVYNTGQLEPNGNHIFDLSYNITNYTGHKWGQGLFPSLALDLSGNSAGGGRPYVAWFSGEDFGSPNLGQQFDRSIYLSTPNVGNDPAEQNDWEHTLIDKYVVDAAAYTGGKGPYQDLSEILHFYINQTVTSVCS